MRKEPHSCRMLIKSKSVDYEGPVCLAACLLWKVEIRRLQTPFQSLTTHSQDVNKAARPSEEDLVGCLGAKRLIKMLHIVMKAVW